MTLVSCVGLAVHDIIFTVPRLPAGPGKTHATDRTEAGGGPAANAAAAIETLGGRARFIGVLGDDLIGDEIVGDLGGRGVDTTRIRRVPGRRSPVSSISVDGDGERTIVNHADVALFAAASVPSDDDLRGSSAVLVDVRWPAGAETALRWARESSVPGVIDYDLGGENGRDLLQLASHVVFSAGALRLHTGTEDPTEALIRARKSTDAWLAVTLGDTGARWLGHNRAVHEVPPFTVDVVDTTGAGDVYHGVFTLELARGLDEPMAMRTASAAAALSCTRMGGRDGVPTRYELEAFLEKSK